VAQEVETAVTAGAATATEEAATATAEAATATVGAVVKEEEARVAVPCRVDKEAARAMGVVVMVMVAAAMAMAMAAAATVTAVAVRAAVKEAAARAVVGWDTTKTER
jgi:hypothetical protein